MFHQLADSSVFFLPLLFPLFLFLSSFFSVHLFELHFKSSVAIGLALVASGTMYKKSKKNKFRLEMISLASFPAGPRKLCFNCTQCRLSQYAKRNKDINFYQNCCTGIFRFYRDHLPTRHICHQSLKLWVASWMKNVC